MALRWVRKLIAAAMLTLAFVPIGLFFGAHENTPDAGVYILAGAALIALVQLLEALLPNRHRIVGLPLILGITAALFVLFYSGAATVLFAVPLLIYAVVSLALARKMAERTMSITQLTAGASVYAAAYVLSFIWNAVHIQGALRLWCSVYLVLGILLQNMASVDDTAGAGNTRALRMGNLAMTAGFVLLAIALINIRAIGDFFGWLLHGVFSLLMWLSNLFGTGGGQGMQGAGGDFEQMLPEGDEGGGMPAWVEVLLAVIAALILIALAVFALVAIAKGLADIYRRLRLWLSPPAAEAADYSDEQSSLMDWQRVRADLLGGIGKAIRRIAYRPPRWDSLTNREKVRYAMQGMLFRGGRYAPDPALTAREQLSGVRGKGDSAAFADAYDRARYSQQHIADEDARNARKFL